MSAPFSFPPPPPPPPKPASSNRGGTFGASAFGQNQQARGGYRGGHNERGNRGSTRGSRGDRGSSFQPRGSGVSRGTSAWQQGRGTHPNADRSSLASSNTTSNQPYGNTHRAPFTTPNGAARGQQAHSVRGAFQNTHAFGHNRNVNGTSTDNPGPQSLQHTQPRADRSRGGHARGRGNARGNATQRPQRQRVPAAPAVPSFGFNLPTPPPSITPARSTDISPANKRRKLNGLGLTPEDKVPDYEDVEDSDEQEAVDEEAAWIGSDGPLVVEHNGRTVRLSDTNEIKAWIAERKNLFPTTARVAQRKQELAERRARLEWAAAGKSGSSEIPSKRKSSTTSAEELQRLRLKVQESLKKQVESADAETQETKGTSMLPDGAHVQSVEDVQSSEESLRAENQATEPNLGVEVAQIAIAGVTSIKAPDGVENGLLAGYDSEGSNSCSDDLDALSSEVSSDSDDDISSDSDEAPEVQTTRLAPVKNIAAAQIETKPRDSVCANWKRNGACQRGARCKFEHPPKPQASKSRTTLLERFKEQQQKDSDRLALEAIKYLGDKGFLD